MDQEKYNELTERLDRIEGNIIGLGVSVNSVVDTVNSFLESAKGMLAGGGLGKLMSVMGGREND